MTLYRKIKKTLKDNNLKYKEYKHDPVRTSEEAATVRKTPLKEGAKALIMEADGNPIMVVVPGNEKADTAQIKSLFGFSKLKMSSVKLAEKLSGTKAGGIPPFGNLFNKPIPVYTTPSLLQNEKIIFNAGTKTISIRMKTSDWQNIVNPQIINYQEAEETDAEPGFFNSIRSTRNRKTNNSKKTKKNTKKFRKIRIPRRSKNANYTGLMILALAISLLIAGLVDRFINTPTPEQTQQEPAKKNINNNENKEITQNAEDTTKPTDSFKPPYIDPPPSVSAKAFGVINLTDNIRMYSKNPNLSLPPASVTKIMTAIITLEEYDLDKEVLIPKKCTKINGSNAGFKAFDVFTIQDLLYGLLVKSGADSACAIANIDGETEFIEKMNRKADELGMKNTGFENEFGFDSIKYQFSSINDLIKLSKYALQYDTFRKIVGTKQVTIYSLNSSNKYDLKNTNDLLFSIPGTVGIKTGYTQEAGECLSYLYENPSRNQKILIVILGSEDRFGDTRTLLNWAKEQIDLTRKPENEKENLGG